MFIALLPFACTTGGPILSAETDGGSWTVTLREAPAESGEVPLELTVAPADGALTALTVSMPDMGHVSDGEITDLGGGDFSALVDFSMPGWWVLDGEVDGAEGFRLELDVP